MNAQEIRNAIDSGLRIFWMHSGYEVIKDRLGQYLIMHKPRMTFIGLTGLAGTEYADVLNGAASGFYVEESAA